jgi:hypothetical protein
MIDGELRGIAQAKAFQSNCVYKVSALGLNRKGEVMAKAFNKHRFEGHGRGIHAERQVMKKKGVKTIIIARVGNGGDLLPITPCDKCKEIADSLGIRIISVLI